MKFLATPLTTLVLCLGVLGATIQVRKPAGSSSSMLSHCHNPLHTNLRML